MPKLYAISDLHLSYAHNLSALSSVEPHPEDSLIIAGDVGETSTHLRQCFSALVPLFKQTWWVPGNHELYTLPRVASRAAREDGADHPAAPELRGELKYRECVAVAREHGVLTPEDDFQLWHGDGGPALVCPIFTLYDYSFRPASVPKDGALQWAREGGIEATDEALLHPDPWGSREEWCAHLVSKFEGKLEDARAEHPDVPAVIVNHWPLTERVCQLPAVPRFTLWCGTKETEGWARKFGAKVVVTGHIHIRRTDWIEGVRYEEVSLGYPKQWKEAAERGETVQSLMREILPGPATPEGGVAATRWRRYG